MGTVVAVDLSRCCGTEIARRRDLHLQRELDDEAKLPILPEEEESQQKPNTTVTIHEDLIAQINNNKQAPFKSRRNRNERRTRSAHTLPKPLLLQNVMGAKSEAMLFNTSLTKQHRERLNRKRRSTIVMRRKKKEHNLPIRIHRVWSILTKSIVDLDDDSKVSGSDDSSDDDYIDIFAVEISYDQFNIILNNHDIQLPAALPPVLIWELLSINDVISSEMMHLGLEKDRLHNDPMKERGFDQKQFKFIFKSKITYNMMKCLMEKLNDDKVLSRIDKLSNPKSVSYKTRNLVIWHKLLQQLLIEKAFNVEDDYLHGVLHDDVLKDLEKIIDVLSSLDSHWKHRIQIMKYIDNETPDLDNEAYDTSILNDLDNDSFCALLNAWSLQLKDSRSAVSKVAINLLPTVLSCLLLCIQYPAVVFDEQHILDPIYDGVFALIKNRRMKDLAEDAYDAFIQITDIFAEIATDLDDYGSLSMIVKTLEDHSADKIEGHAKVREACVSGIGFVLFGVESTSMADTMTMDAINENEMLTDDKTGDTSSEINEKTAPKLSINIQRRYLLENEEFIAVIGNIMANGVTDKNEQCRKKAFELLHKLETHSDGNLLEQIGSEWNYIISKKYNNYKKMQQRKNTKRQTAKRSSSKKKKTKKKKKKKNETETPQKEEIVTAP